MIGPGTAGRPAVLAVALLALSAASLLACSTDEPLVEAGQPTSVEASDTQQLVDAAGGVEGGADVGVGSADGAAGAALPDVTTAGSPTSTGGDTGGSAPDAASSTDGTSSDGASSVTTEPGAADQPDDDTMSVAELQELERALDEIDQLLADLELDLDAD